MLMKLALVAGVLAVIAVMVAVVGLCFYMVGWAVMMAVRFLPMIGKRHRHDRWAQFQTGRVRPPSSNANDKPQ